MLRSRLLLHLASALAVWATCSLATRSHAQRLRPLDGGVVSLTDLNFDEHLANGKPWLVTLNAHYCQLTRELEHAFDKIAEQLHPDVSVGKIDGAVERGLLSRFQLRNLHAVYHINGTETRQYCEGHACEGPRLQTNQLLKFAREGWRTQPPRTGCTSPVSRCGKAVGSITRLPARFKSTYLHLHNDLNYSDLTLFAGLLAVPVVVGLSFICMLDAYYSRRPLAPPPMRPHLD